ncbi:hypothetical protein MMU07_03395 [Aquiflexum sp. LQ15W]|uniref:hypothetical protein n=1 Tax=Cognataquiflexum nitidum TaxID=2922272 RepID=UPI001F12B098|nr:hypothetical protein [Cognataquiflexum nitidum]MCH6198610.1 hypothetical protein [Cognataquiflexum nitidum]
MDREFYFDFKDLSIDDQLFLCSYFGVENIWPVLSEIIACPKELKNLLDKEEYRKVDMLSYLAALLAHHAAIVFTYESPKKGEKEPFREVLLDMEVLFPFEIHWFEGLDNPPSDGVCLIRLIDQYDLLRLAPLFQLYNFFED